MLNRITMFVGGVLVGAVLVYTYEDELDDFRYSVCRCCKKAKKKVRAMRSYID